MAKQRTYGDRCGVARSLDVIGERWSLLVVRELLFGAKRFTDLRKSLPKISAEVLGQRLSDLEGAGIVYKKRLPPPTPVTVYELTETGKELEPVIIELGRWGAGLVLPGAEVSMSLDSHLLSMKTLFNSSLAPERADVELQIQGELFHVQVHAGQIDIERGSFANAQLVIETDPSTLLALIRSRVSLDDALRGGDVAIEGDKAVLERFLGAFPLPLKDGVSG